MTHSYSIKFYLNKAKSRGDEYKIYGRLIIDRKKSEFATNYFISEDKWDSAKGRARKNININEELGELENTINRIRRKFIDEEKPVSANGIISILKGDKKEKRELLEYMQEHINEIKLKGEHSPFTLNHYTTSQSIYKKFIKHQYNKEDIPINKIDADFIKAFDLYIMSVYNDRHNNNISRNTANKHHSRLRTIFIKAHSEGLMIENPYSRYQLRNNPSNRKFLTPEEIKRIIALDFSNNITLDRVRDFFFFSCFTSLRFSDAFNLKLSDIIETTEGKKMVSIKMEKTKEMVYVPLIEEALGIISKYDNESSRIIAGFVLPRYSNQKVNIYLKHIATLAEIEKELTHHVARHTFATIALNKSIPLEAVQKLLGHNSIRTTQIYAKMRTSTLEKEMEKFKI